ncbi:hypothetical protein SAMN03159494_04191 [Achromobacter sp. NFACC18-2]|uniref:hypothetical protein n=2 Tax=unclassified Achromobacter TaxID=2626865 RepID=UPI0008C42904|nr:hypothetical protein [Achromobacter sp. MFA1 R4]SEJ98486.1 hypothetical protein SAMN03159494_04191 [Achromobacter sp. NFACC18-2]SIT27084.1 hypothetical protein SAMN05428937_3478 [Achromobacter sp. MFA1 R4]
MTPHTAPDTPGLRLDLPSGASRLFALRAGATLICTSGSMRVEEAANGCEAAGGLHRVVSVRLNAGEAHGVSYGGAVRLTAIGGAQVICLDAAGPVTSFLRRGGAFFHRILSKTGNIRVGALHKISK